MESSTVFVVLVSLAVCYPASAHSVQYKSELDILAHKEFKALFDSFTTGNSGVEVSGKRPVLGSFVYENCDDASKETIVVSNLTVSPDPVRLPGKLNISFDSVIKAKFGAPLKAKLSVHKKVFGFWIEVPCVDDIGSCTYDNICDKMAKLVKTCPPVLVKQGFNCRCPFSPAKLSLKNYPVSVSYKVPSVADGEVKVKVDLYSGNTLLTCLQVTLTLN